MAATTQNMITYDGEEGPIQAYLARPDTQEPRPAVIVIHEIFGLTEHIEDVANRFVEQGYVVLAPHLFSHPGMAGVLTPSNIEASMRFMATIQRERASDQAYLREEMSRLPPGNREAVQNVFPLLFGGASKESWIQDLVRAVDYLGSQSYVEAGRIASVGFCFGGGLSINLACRAKLAASVIFYGENPNPVDQVQNVAGPVLGLYGAEDMRINSHLDELVQAMVQYKKDFEMRIYPGAGHAFFNDTRSQVYREAAARDAWDRVLRFYRRTLLEP